MRVLDSSIELGRNGLYSYKMDWIEDSRPSPREATATVAVMVLHTDGLLLSQHPQKGWQVLGGHIEGDERPDEAAIRESREEGGAVISKVMTIGYIRMELLAEKPVNYQYPYPSRYCQMYAAQLDRLEPFRQVDDAVDRRIFAITDLPTLPEPQSLGRELLFLPIAVDALGLKIG